MFFLPEQTRLFLNREGRWFHEGQPLTHGRLVSALNAGLYRSSDGSCRTRIGLQEAFVDLEETMLFVLQVTLDETAMRFRILLNTGKSCLVEPADFFHQNGEYLYCRLGDEIARLGRAAHQNLLDWIEEDHEGLWVLRLGNRLWPLHELRPTEIVTHDDSDQTPGQSQTSSPARQDPRGRIL